jgi:hypothetical protein
MKKNYDGHRILVPRFGGGLLFFEECSLTSTGQNTII